MSKKPQRIQLKRTKGFNLQTISKALNELEAVKIARPSKWGCPFKIGETRHDGKISYKLTRAKVMELYRPYLENELKKNPDLLNELKGKNVACFCKLTENCHGDILLEFAQRKESS